MGMEVSLANICESLVKSRQLINEVVLLLDFGVLREWLGECQYLPKHEVLVEMIDLGISHESSIEAWEDSASDSS